MAAPNWQGTAPKVAQLDTYTPASITIGNIVTLTDGNGNTISFTATAATVANVTAGLVTAIANASTAGTLSEEFKEVSFADITTALTGTASTPGKPFTITSSWAQGSGSAGGSFTRSATTANSGPNNWDVAANWDTNAVPITGDTPTVDGTVDILYGLAQSAVTLASLTIPATYTGKIGLPKWTGLYYEYRATYLNIKSTLVNIGDGEGAGSGRINLDTDNAAVTGTVMKTASSAETGTPAVRWKGTHANNAWRINRGTFGAAFFAGEVATILSLKQGYVNNRQSDSIVTLGKGVTITGATFEKSGGILTLNDLLTGGAELTFIQTDGTTTISGEDADFLLLNVGGGVVYYASNGTIAAAKCGPGELNFNRDMRACNVTRLDLYAGYKLTDSESRVAWGAGKINFNNCKITADLDLGWNIALDGVTAL